MNIEDHQSLIQVHEDTYAQLKRKCLVLGLMRLGVFIALFVAMVQLAALASAWAIVISALCLFLFMILTFMHVALDQDVQFQKYNVLYHKQGIDRCNGQWQHGQADGRTYLNDWHPYAHDIDLIGSHGLFAFLNTLGSELGRKKLASVLFDDSYVAQAAELSVIKKLAQHDQRRAYWWSALQQETQLWSSEEEQQVFQQYRDWLSKGDMPKMPAAIESVLRYGFIAASLAGFFVIGWSWLWTGCIVIAIIASIVNDRAMLAWQELDGDRIDRLLRSWMRALDHVQEAEAEEACYSSDEHKRIGDLKEHLKAQLKYWHGLALRANPLWRYGLGAVLMSDWFYRRRLCKWRQQHAVSCAQSLEILAEIDLAHACATYAAEQGGCWATQSEAEQLFKAEDLAHPLLSRDQRVGNSIQLQAGQVLLLTGANASGKSTFLRSIALAALMSRIGLPVCALACALQPQRLAAVMRVEDALWKGMSRFQAEVAQLKRVLDRSQSAGSPVMLLLDEILAGTNSTERHRGTRAFIKHLVSYNGLILLTTHDLDLATLADEDPERIRCYHFADRAVLDSAESADVQFDYCLREGVLQSTNALHVMQAAGLPIE